MCLFCIIIAKAKLEFFFQTSRIMNFPTSAEIYQLLVDAGIAKENIEACYLPKERRFNFLIKLNTTDEGLPAVKGHGYSLCYAGLLYSIGRDGKILTHSLIISPYLGHILGSHVEQLQLTFSASQTIDLNVLYEFNATLDRVLNKIRQNHKRRRDIVSTLLALYPCNVAFYDEDLYSQGNHSYYPIACAAPLPILITAYGRDSLNNLDDFCYQYCNQSLQLSDDFGYQYCNISRP